HDGNPSRCFHRPPFHHRANRGNRDHTCGSLLSLFTPWCDLLAMESRGDGDAFSSHACGRVTVPRLRLYAEEMTGNDVAERAEHRAFDVRMLDLELGDQALDALSLQAQVAARRAAAADDRQAALACVGARIALADVHERPDDDVTAVVGHQPRRPRLER